MAKTRYVQKKPDFKSVKLDSKDYKKRLNDILYYAQYEVTGDTLKKETLKWCEINLPNVVANIKQLSDYYFNAIGKYCYVLNYGAELSESYITSLKTQIELLNQTAVQQEESKEPEPEEEVKQEKPKRMSVKDRVQIQVLNVCGEIEGWIDECVTNPKDFSLDTVTPEKLFKTHEFKAAHYRIAEKIYRNDMKEIAAVIEGSDKELVEAYSYLGKRDLNKLLKIYQMVIDSCEKMKKAAAVRRPKSKKPLDIAKMTKNVKYLIKSDELNITSVQPVHIVGAQDMWTFNTKTRKLAHYVALDSTGLSVKGTTIGNLSDTSTEKTIRKPDEFLKTFMKVSKRSKPKSFSDIKSIETKLKGRLNEYTLILEVNK